MKNKKKLVPHPRSCVYCAYCWFHEPEFEEVMFSGPAGWVCDGHRNQGMANLKNFPFLNERECFAKTR